MIRKKLIQDCNNLSEIQRTITHFENSLDDLGRQTLKFLVSKEASLIVAENTSAEKAAANTNINNEHPVGVSANHYLSANLPLNVNQLNVNLMERRKCVKFIKDHVVESIIFQRDVKFIFKRTF